MVEPVNLKRHAGIAVVIGQRGRGRVLHLDILSAARKADKGKLSPRA
jgi:hypothetical protein